MFGQCGPAPALSGRGRLRSHVFTPGPDVTGCCHSHFRGLHCHCVTVDHHCNGNQHLELLIDYPLTAIMCNTDGYGFPGHLELVLWVGSWFETPTQTMSYSQHRNKTQQLSNYSFRMQADEMVICRCGLMCSLLYRVFLDVHECIFLRILHRWTEAS